MRDAVIEAAETVAELEARLAEAQADLNTKQAYTAAQRLAEVMHRHLCPEKNNHECYWEQEFDYNQTPAGFHAWEHEKWERKAAHVLRIVPTYEDALMVLKVMTNPYED